MLISILFSGAETIPVNIIKNLQLFFRNYFKKQYLLLYLTVYITARSTWYFINHNIMKFAFVFFSCYETPFIQPTKDFELSLSSNSAFQRIVEFVTPSFKYHRVDKAINIKIN